jgi:AbrB family looped-hinge helix DNA binding protein
MGLRLQIGPDNQVILPDEAMRELELQPGDEIEVETSDGEVVLRRPSMLAWRRAAGNGDPRVQSRSLPKSKSLTGEEAVPRAYGILKRPGLVLTEDEMDVAIRQARTAMSERAEKLDQESR